MSKISTLSDAQSFSDIQNSLGHLNNMDGVSYDINNPLLKLRVIASSCFFGEPAYYKENSHSSETSSISKSNLDYAQKYVQNVLGQMDCFSFNCNESSKNLLEKQIDIALSYDARATLEEAVRLRHEDNIRTTPQVIMVRAANHESVRGTGLVREFGNKIMARADEPAVQLAYQLSAFGRKKIPNSLKRAWKTFLEKQSEFNLAKYRLEGKKVKTLDVVNLCHAKGPEIDLLMRGELKLSADDTWEALISQNGSNSQNWTKAIDLMGHMALLRNLRNFKVNSVNMSAVYEKLVATASTGKQLPFRYYSAAKALSSITKEDEFYLSQCLNLSMGTLPKFNGRVMSLCDNSGSARGSTTSEMGTVMVSEIANLSAILTAKNSDEGYVGVFGDKLNVSKVSSDVDVFSEMDRLNEVANTVGANTENGIWLFFDNAIKTKEHWDHIFVYSDMQAGHGGLYGLNKKEYSDYCWMSGKHIDVAKLIKVYREKVNPNVHIYLVQVAGYGDSLVPEFYNKTYILGGWGSGLFKFAHKMQTINEMIDGRLPMPGHKNVQEKPVLNLVKEGVAPKSSERPKKRNK